MTFQFVFCINAIWVVRQVVVLPHAAFAHLPVLTHGMAQGPCLRPLRREQVCQHLRMPRLEKLIEDVLHGPQGKLVQTRWFS